MKKSIREDIDVNNINAALVKNLTNDLQKNFITCSSEIENLKNSLQLFQDSFKDYFNLAIERNKIINKYSSEEVGSTYGLPGVFASSMGAYDLDGMKADNEKLLKINNTFEAAANQKDTYENLVIESQNKISVFMKNIQNICADLDIVVEKLSEN